MIKLKSTNPKFSWILRKNPETQRTKNEPFSKALRKGKVHGWFVSNDQEFRMWFQDSPTESSFNTISDFEYLDRTRYCSPYLPIAMIATLLASAQKEDTAEDEEGFENSFECLVELSEPGMAKRIIKTVTEIQIDLHPLGATLFKVVFSSKKSIKTLLNWVIAFLITQSVRDENLYVPMDDESVKKYVKALVEINAPYYMRYITALKCIRSPHIFASIKPVLDEDKFDLNFGDTQNHRWIAIEKHLSGGDILMDIGCGEMFYSKRLKSRYENTMAFDADEKIQEKNQHIAEIRAMDKIEFFGKYDDTSPVPNSKYTDVLLTEVLEHIEFFESVKLLNRVLSGNFQKVVVTVPNKDFNVFYGIPSDEMRHHDHKFEPTQTDFEYWMSSAADEAGVNVEFFNVGDAVTVKMENHSFNVHASLGAVFTKKINES